MSKTGSIKLVLGIMASLFILIGAIFTIWTYRAKAKGYELVEFTVTDYDVTDVRKHKERHKKSYKVRYRIRYDVEYEYEFDGEKYTYVTSGSMKSRSKDTQPCDIGDVKKFYINPDDPANEDDFVAAANGIVGIAILGIGVIIIIVAVVLKEDNGHNKASQYYGYNQAYGYQQPPYGGQGNSYNNQQIPYNGQGNPYNNFK